MKPSLLLMLSVLVTSLVLQSRPAEAAEGVQIMGRVQAAQANVRTGPGVDFDVFTQVKRGARIAFTGRDESSAWLYFLYYDKPAWLSASVVVLDTSGKALPVMSGGQTEVVLKSFSTDPPQPAPGQPFVINLSLENKGADAAPLFQVATTFEGGQFVMVTVPHIGAGEVTIVRLECPGMARTGVNKLILALDINRQLNEEPGAGLPEITVWIDAAKTLQTTLRIPSETNVALQNGLPDIAYDGLNLTPLGSARLVPLPDDTKLADLHSDMLANATTQPASDLNVRTGRLFAMITGSGAPGWLRVTKVDEGAIEIEFTVYAVRLVQ